MRAFNVMFGGSRAYSNLENCPLVALYDFCNAFATLLHEWLFLVITRLRFPLKYRWLIRWLYQRILVYSLELEMDPYYSRFCVELRRVALLAPWVSIQ